MVNNTHLISKTNYYFFIFEIKVHYKMLSKINLNLNTKNKAIQDYKARHQSIQILLQKANEKYEKTRKQINDECISINQTLCKLKQKSKQFITSCQQALRDNKTSQIINMKDLSQYLKKEKQFLKSIAHQKQSKNQNKLNLHDLVSKVSLQRILIKIKRMQLQQQIKFLQGNVLVKGNFIYNPSNSLFISPTEDKENNQRLANLIQQLQRLIQLSIPCITNSNINYKLLQLKSQSLRIQQCQTLITEQHQKLANFTQLLDQRRQSIDKFSLSNTAISFQRQEQQTNQIDQYEQLKVQEIQLDSILELNEQKALVINMQHPFVPMQQKIGQLRNKLKKLQKLI